MPDGDVFTNSAPRFWRSVADALRDALAPKECGSRIEDALTKDLRAHGGLKMRDLRELLSIATGSTDEQRMASALEGLARRRVIDRVVPHLVGTHRFSSFDQATAFIRHCLAETRFDVIARSLARRPDGVRLRRPPRSKVATADLLAESAPLGDGA